MIGVFAYNMVQLTLVAHHHIGLGWVGKVDFCDEGFCSDSLTVAKFSTEGSFRNRYIVPDAEEGKFGAVELLKTLISDLARLNIHPLTNSRLLIQVTNREDIELGVDDVVDVQRIPAASLKALRDYVDENNFDIIGV